MVRLRGDVDLAAAPRLRAALVDLDQRGHHHLELDLGLVDHLDSTALGVLLGALRRARSAGGELRITAASPIVRRLLEVVGLGPSFGLPGNPDPGR